MLYKKHNSITTQQLDVCNKAELQSTIKKYDLVINAVPGFLGFDTLKAIINAGMNVIDIAFFLKIHWGWMFWQKKKM